MGRKECPGETRFLHPSKTKGKALPNVTAPDGFPCSVFACVKQKPGGETGSPCPQRRPVSPREWGSDYREPLGSQRNFQIDSVRDANSVQSESPEVLKLQRFLQEDTGMRGTEGRADGLMNIRGTRQAVPRKEVLIKGKKPQVADLFAFHY